MMELPISPPVKPIVVELPISPPVEPIVVELPISPPVKHVMFELPIAPVEAESLQRFEGLTQRHKKRKTDMETSVPQARTTLPPPSLLDYFALPTTQRCQRAQNFFPPPPLEPIVVELPISPPVKPIVVELPISPPVKPIVMELPNSPPVKPIVVELPMSPPVKPIVDELPIFPPLKPVVVELSISPPVKPIMVELPISPTVKPIVVELPISPPVNHQDQPCQGANWEIEAGSSQIVDAPAHLPLPTSSDLPQQSPQEQPGVLTAFPGPLANIGTLEEMIEVAWQKCQEYQSMFFMWYFVTLLCTQSRAQPIFPPVKPIVVELPISPPVEPIVVELPISPPVEPIMVELPIFPPVKPVVVELPISPPVKPIMVELPISPPVKHVMFDLPIAPVDAESLQRFEGALQLRKNKPLKGLTQRHKKSKKDMKTSVPQARTTLPPPSLLDYFAQPTTQRCQRSQDFFPPPPMEPIVVEEPISPPANPILDELPIFPPVKPVVVELPISPPVKPVVVELPISPPVKPVVVELPISPPVKPVVVDLPISPPVKHVMFELPIAPVEAESLQRFEGLTQRHKKRKTDMETSVPQARTTLPPPSLLDFFAPPTTQRCQRAQNFFPPPQVEPIVVELPISSPVKPIVFDLPICSVEAESLQRFEGCQGAQDFFDSPPPQGCQMALHGVNPYSMRAGAPMSKYPGYPCTTTKAGPGISDASLVHMLRPLSPMLVPEDDGGWDSAGDHMSTPGTPFYMG
ncbi:proline-rich extensin-like protein EPR1 isoform X2 [Oncorhynchus tshawytscha]|uniref:proline-rich extensin-like protein EPR1 isoform X2 n=1 Tax=Oncorhynchus tshawytscha TaxID=74940 RepID=UPI001C3CB6A1|nr:proline-rich extensin-like protein EPR1 isoform X2 [Oncorhynchus tshawytscha]